MYSDKDILVIFNPYFTVIHLSSHYCELKSNNTGHFWRIVQSEDGYFQIYHKHRQNDKYHTHLASDTLENCFLEIISHDEYQLRGRKPARYHFHTFFDDVLAIYQYKDGDLNIS